MNRREFITLIGGATATWPIAARGQQPTMPVIGFLSPSEAGTFPYLPGLRRGLRDAGYVEGQNLTIEYRWAGRQLDHLPQFADDLVRRRVAVIVSGPGPAVVAAKAATNTIPIVFQGGSDPVKAGLVASLNRPGGNVTGVFQLSIPLTGKRLELLHRLAPQSEVIAVFRYARAVSTDEQSFDFQEAARGLGLRLLTLEISSEQELEAAFERLAQQQAGALYVAASFFFVSRRDRIVELAARHRVAACYESREFVAAGGLMSYGADFSAIYRQVGVYAGRILNGEKPAELPVVQPTKFELVLNLQSAKALGIEISPSILALADEVIE